MAKASFMPRFVVRIALSKTIVTSAALFVLHGATRSAERRLPIAASTRASRSQLGAFVCVLSYIKTPAVRFIFTRHVPRRDR